jgi:phospholipase C
VDPIHKIRHVIVIIQENRSFDHYFGTYPGADGLPRRNGHFTVCQPNPATGGCARPYHDADGMDHGGPHDIWGARAVIDGGRMDGFVSVLQKRCESPAFSFRIMCRQALRHPDVMGYHDAREIPNYWAYARNFVLQDHMFASNMGFSLTVHLAIVSAWAANCRRPPDPMSCTTAGADNDKGADQRFPHTPSFAWTDLTYLLHRHHVSWRYYVAPKTPKDCDDGMFLVCPPDPYHIQGTPEFWNPLPDFVTVHQNHQLGNVQVVSRFFHTARTGTLPAVSWIAPDSRHSEHPAEPISAGQAWVTRLVNAVMRGPQWKSTAIFLTWDEWGGFYDHLAPPSVDRIGYGIRVPGLLISAYARRGYVDHQVLTSDAYLKLIEDDFLGGQRIDPRTDGRPDRRPNVREALRGLGDLRSEFDFSKPPRRPLLLPPKP